MKTEEEIREYYRNFRNENPKEWIYSKTDKGIQGWYQGMEQALMFVLGEDEL